MYVCIAGHTVQRVMRKCKFEICFPCIMNGGRICRNLHAVGDPDYTGPLKGPGFLDLDDAHSASALLGNAFEVAESRDVISCALASIQDSDYTGPLKGPGFLDLDDAHSASALLGNAFEVAESRDVISCALASIQDSHSHRKLIVLLVDLHVDQFLTHHEFPPGVLLFENSTKTADFIARATFSALIHIDNLGLPDLTSDGLDRALTCASIRVLPLSTFHPHASSVVP